MPNHLLKYYQQVRARSEEICAPLQTEDYVVQPVAEVSPPKWHLGHTSWFFETFVLADYQPDYQVFNDQFNYIFNSYYETVGKRVVRTDRGNLSRPTVKEIYAYRAHVNQAMQKLILNQGTDAKLVKLITLGLQHEQQHQELLITDIKYILGHNPLLPPCTLLTDSELPSSNTWLTINSGLYTIGHSGQGFCFDNELCQHKVYLNPFQIQKHPVSNVEFLQFIKAGGYQNFEYWHSAGWDWVQQNKITAPLYWHYVNGEWRYYNTQGLTQIALNQAVNHISYYEASAYAQWKGLSLPTEAQWEVASEQLNWGQRWEWTNSAYLPYPGFKKLPGAIGEYNGKFMVNQMVLRGASIATSPGHARVTYRNFFHPHERWQFMGLRLVRNQ
ncbi:ergothioneine biosynthesis protein EgtB [Gayadomonas joobiniege]|uniref:ergothioneine biosynthesis protein EgtB n=1 Tax=Gayadomonas joobiniege TaxID=1234606 RepID=UPI000363E9AE|nr:ergothioneine biosynthesis protein EgtB [Gayadomonas joobiniege]